MGGVLRRSAFSPKIRDRLDFSCAIFDANEELSNAHPVHFSLAYAMRSIVSEQIWQPGDMLGVNDPFLGGIHFSDVTVIAPVFVQNQCVAFVANRVHHANIGAISPGSMSIFRRLEAEGIIIPPSLIMKNNQLNHPLLNQLAGLTESIEWDVQGLPDHPVLDDFLAQISRNRAGVSRLTAQLNHYGEKLARAKLAKSQAVNLMPKTV